MAKPIFRILVFVVMAANFWMLHKPVAHARVLHRRDAPQTKKIPVAPPTPVDKGLIENRWKVTPPPYEINKPGKLINPYRQNKLKGDYPILGQDVFFILTATSSTLVEAKKLPVPSGPSAAGPGRFNFFGNGNLLEVQQNFRPTFELYRGNTAFEPRKWELKVTPVFNINYLKANERGVVNVNVARGTERTQFDFALQEATAEYHIANISPRFDFVSIRGGIQPFTSDFRGFIFSDSNLGGRLFGNFSNNRYQWNLAAFDMLEKDTNSELNAFSRREQQVAIANLYRQDFFNILGWTHQWSLHWNHDQRSLQFDKNGFLVRPDPAGAATPHRVDAVYLGWASDGHFNRFNVAHAFYFVFGEDSLNPIAEREVNIYGQMAAVELSYDRDWFRLRGSFLYTSGDDDPRDDSARGFDSIVDFPKFAGGENSFFHHQPIRLAGIGLTQRNSFMPNLRSSKLQGQANFVNPGLFLYNLGADIEILQELRALVNVNYLRFVTTESLELLLNQGNIRNEIGWDFSLGLQYRPFLNNNVIVNANGAVFKPGQGFRDMLTSGILYQAFTNLILTY